MKFPTCFALSNSILGLRDAAAVLGCCSSFDALSRARRVDGDAGAADAGGVDRPRGDGHEPGVLVPVDPREDDGHGFRHELALFQGDFGLRKNRFSFRRQKRVFSAADSTELPSRHNSIV